MVYGLPESPGREEPIADFEPHAAAAATSNAAAGTANIVRKRTFTSIPLCIRVTCLATGHRRHSGIRRLCRFGVCRRVVSADAVGPGAGVTDTNATGLAVELLPHQGPMLLARRTAGSGGGWTAGNG